MRSLSVVEIFILGRMRALFALRSIPLLMLAACASNSPPPPATPAPVTPVAALDAPLEQWSTNHPEAARELGEWVNGHRPAARLFFEWDGHHPDKAHEFVTWSIANPAGGVDGFVLTHQGWRYFDKIALEHGPAADALMAWCRRHPQAAEALMSHPRGLVWAGKHLYAESAQ